VHVKIQAKHLSIFNSEAKMKKFLYRLLMIGMSFGVVLSIIDYYYSEIVAESNHHRSVEAWYDLMHGKIDADIIVMGSSRAWVHINPLILDSILHLNTYNIGIDGSTINRQIHKYNLFRKYNKKPKLIIQNIDTWSLGYGTGYEKEQFFPYFWNMDMRKEFFSSEPLSKREKYIPMYRYRDIDIKRLFLKSPQTLTKGYKGIIREWNGEEYNNVKSLYFKNDDATVEMFDEYLAQTKAEGIKVVFVYTPQYIGATQKITNIDEMHNCYKKIADKYNIPILDYSHMNICYDTAYFYNAMHLNKQGAEIFSDSLAHDINRLNLAPI